MTLYHVKLWRVSSITRNLLMEDIVQDVGNQGPLWAVAYAVGNIREKIVLLPGQRLEVDIGGD